MWAIKNFVCGPSAAVTFSRRPYPGALSRKPKAMAPPADNLTELYIVVLWRGAMWALLTLPTGCGLGAFALHLGAQM